MLHDVCLMNLHVVFTFDRAGVVGKDGATHQGVYDLAYLSNMPNIKIFAPNSVISLKNYLHHALYREKGPVVIRYPKGRTNLPEIKETQNPEKVQLLRDGKDCIIFSYGKMMEEAFSAAEILEDNGYKCSVADISCLKPIDFDGVENLSNGKKLIACLEDVIESGSCSMQIGNHLSKGISYTEYLGFNLGDNFLSSGETEEILEAANLKGVQIAGKMINILDNTK